MKPELLFYMHLLCACLGGLDNYDERALVRRLILRNRFSRIGGTDMRRSFAMAFVRILVRLRLIS